MDTFHDFLEAARRDHTDHTDAVAAQLEGGLPHVGGSGDVAPYASFVVHVFGEHLGEWDRGIRLLEAIGELPPALGDAQALLAVRRGIAALRHARGDTNALSGFEPADVAQVMCTICTMHVARHETAAAIAALEQALRAAGSRALPEKHAAIRALAVAGNNLAAELEGREHLADEERAAMVVAAETGLKYWKLAGTWLQEERAEYQLARCLLRAGETRGARESIARCRAICEANGAPAFEHFFAHAVRALVERVDGDDESFLEAKEAALAAYAELAPDEQAWCQRELAELDA